MAANSFTMQVKALIAKASYTTDALAVAAIVAISTKILSSVRDLVTVYLNCDADGSGSLDVDFQITPDDSSEVWYSTDSFQQVVALASKQAIVPRAIGRQCRTYPVLTGTHNFGTKITFPLRGYLGS